MLNTILKTCIKAGLLTVLFWGQLALANYEQVEIELDTGTSMSLTKFPASGKTLMVWFPSERGMRDGYIPVAMDMTFAGVDVWSVDLHATYMVPKTRQSMAEFDVDDLVSLLQHAKTEGFSEIYIATAGRGAQLALKVGLAAQKSEQGLGALRGFVFVHPHFIKGRPELGVAADYVAVAKQSNLPIYMLQPEYSTKYARSKEIVETLETGGSSVVVHSLKEVHGGFHTRPEEDLSEVDLAVKSELATITNYAISLLRDMPTPPLKLMADNSVKADKKAAFREPSLYPYKGDKSPAPLKLQMFEGDIYDLSQAKDEVILVNFWATWCGPCVKEIPSLSRLVERLKDKPFRVITVNIGEPESVIKEFVKAIPLNFPILLDSNGDAVRDWHVYAYPSNYLIDKNGKIQYAYRGALEWDSEAVVETIESLF